MININKEKIIYDVHVYRFCNASMDSCCAGITKPQNIGRLGLVLLIIHVMLTVSSTRHLWSNCNNSAYCDTIE